MKRKDFACYTVEREFSEGICVKELLIRIFRRELEQGGQEGGTCGERN